MNKYMFVFNFQEIDQLYHPLELAHTVLFPSLALLDELLDLDLDIVVEGQKLLLRPLHTLPQLQLHCDPVNLSAETRTNIGKKPAIVTLRSQTYLTSWRIPSLAEAPRTPTLTTTSWPHLAATTWPFSSLAPSPGMAPSIWRSRAPAASWALARPRRQRALTSPALAPATSR